jgi:hypothetical protein
MQPNLGLSCDTFSAPDLIQYDRIGQSIAAALDAVEAHRERPEPLLHYSAAPASRRAGYAGNALVDWATAAKLSRGAVLMNMQVRSLTELIGAEIVGVDLGKPLDEATKSRLYRYFADRAVLVFRDQDLDPPRFAAAAFRSSSTIIVCRNTRWSARCPTGTWSKPANAAPFAARISIPITPTTRRRRRRRFSMASRSRRAAAAIPNSPRCRPPMTICPRRRSAGLPG